MVIEQALARRLTQAMAQSRGQARVQIAADRLYPVRSPWLATSALDTQLNFTIRQGKR
jgi:hypothetical protein